MSGDFDTHLCDSDHSAARLILACLACRNTEPGFEQCRETFGMMLDAVLHGAGDCRWCLSDVLADLAWIAAQWATPEQETELAADLAAELDRRSP